MLPGASSVTAAGNLAPDGIQAAVSARYRPAPTVPGRREYSTGRADALAKPRSTCGVTLAVLGAVSVQ